MNYAAVPNAAGTSAQARATFCPADWLSYLEYYVFVRPKGHANTAKNLVLRYASARDLNVDKPMIRWVAQNKLLISTPREIQAATDYRLRHIGNISISYKFLNGPCTGNTAGPCKRAHLIFTPRHP